MLSAAITAATSTATTVGAEAGRDGPGHHRPHTDGCGQGPCNTGTLPGAGVAATAWPGVGWAGVVATVAASPPGVLCAGVFAGG
jgi:hypothetical protein